MRTNPSFFPLPRRWLWHEFQVAQERLPTLQFNWPVFPRPLRKSPTEAGMICVMRCFLRTYLDALDPDIQAHMGTLAFLIVKRTQMQQNQSDTLCGTSQRPIDYGRGWPPIAIMPGARHNQVGKCMLLSWQALVHKYEHLEEGI